MRLLLLWDSPGKNTGECCQTLLQGISPTQESHLSLSSPALAGGSFFFTISATWEAYIYIILYIYIFYSIHYVVYTIYISDKKMATHSSTLAWKIPWTEEPDGLQSMGSRRIGHDWATSLSLFTFMRWRRKRQPTPVFLPGESQRQGIMVGCRLWGRTESDTTEAT